MNVFPYLFPENASSSNNTGAIVTDGGTITGTADYPIVELNMYGKSVQDGTPTPGAPIDIVSVGDDGNVKITSCGESKNLYNISASTRQVIYEDGSIVDDSLYFLSDYIPCNNFDAITISGVVGAGAVWYRIAKYDNDKNFIVRIVEKDVKTGAYTFDVSDCAYIRLCYEDSPQNNNAIVTNVQIEYGDTATAYEPFAGYTATITSGLPLCSVGDVRDELIYNADGTGKIIKRLYTYNFSGNEPFEMIDNNALVGFGITAGLNIPTIFVPTRNDSKVTISAISNIGIIGSQESTATGQSVIGVSQWGETQYVYFSAKEFTDVSTIKGQLRTMAESGKPAELLYQLATPQEIELSAAEMAELMQLQTYNGVTNIFNDNGAEMTVKVATNPLLSEYVMPVIEGITAKFEERIAALEAAITNT